MTRDILRRCRFTPYRKPGPSFSLTMWATSRQDHRGQTVIGYELKMHFTATLTRALRDGGIKACERRMTHVLFSGEDFAGSPMHGDDSDECVKSLMTFLTLRPGDTDAEYFESYTADQLAYCDHYAEALSSCVDYRFPSE